MCVGGRGARCMFAVFCNSRMQQRTAREDRLEIPACRGVWLDGARKGGIGTESWLLSLHKHCGREHSEIRTTSECRRPLLCAVAR